MACALTQGYTLDCRDSVGGVKELYFMEFANATTITVAASVVTGITKASTKRFWKYKPARDTASAKETVNASVANGTLYYAQEIQMAINKLQTNTNLELQKLAQNNLLIVVRDNNDKNWLYGYKNGMDVTAGEGGTGAAPGDRNGIQFTFSGSEPALALEVDATTYGTLETPGA